MTNKPQSVIRHEHVWASPAHEAIEAGRLDVCLLSDGEAVVWDVDPDLVMRAGNLSAGLRWTWDEAMEAARSCAEDRGSLVADRWVRIMCDHCADPVWLRNGCMAEVVDLPIGADLSRRLHAWSEQYQEAGGFGDIDLTAPLAPDALQTFSTEGLAIARALKAALPDWTVVYHDEQKARSSQHDEPREVWEHEVRGEP